MTTTRGGLCLALVAAAVVSGCYTNVPVRMEVAPVGTRVSLDLTERGTLEMRDTLGGSAVSIEGRVQSSTSDHIMLQVNRVQLRDGTRVTWSREPVGIPRAYVSAQRERRFSLVRSVLTGAAVTTAFVFVVTRLGVDLGLGPTFGGGRDGPVQEM